MDSVALCNRTNNSRVDLAIAHTFHHCQMLEVVVRLEKSVTGEKLDEDATNAPYVTCIAPTQVEDDLWCSVVPR